MNENRDKPKDNRLVKRSGKLGAHGGDLTGHEHPRIWKCSVGAWSRHKL